MGVYLDKSLDFWVGIKSVYLDKSLDFWVGKRVSLDFWVGKRVFIFKFLDLKK